MIIEFKSAVIERLGYYVYVLIDPRDGKIFYVGKGRGNRVFDHVNEAESSDKENDKLDIIRDIKASGNEVKYYIIRHGLTEDEAYLVESVLIDLLTFKDFSTVAKIANIQAGRDQASYGIKTVEEVEELYSHPLVDRQHKLLCININQTYTPGGNIYQATRKSWALDKHRADKADYVVGEYKGVIRGIYEVDEKGWQEEAPSVTALLGKAPKRYFFEGKAVEDPKILDRYLDKRLPEKKKGHQNPVWYLFD